MITNILDNIFDYIKKNTKNNLGIDFNDFWTDAQKKFSINPEYKSDIYTQMLQDTRFLNIGDNKWRLREDVSFEEFKRIKSAMYGIENLENSEEEKRTKTISLEDGDELDE